MKIIFYFLTLAALLFCLNTKLFSQVNIIPVRTDLAGYTTWTDTDAGGTTYVQLLQSTSNIVTPAMDFTAYTGEELNFKARTYGGVNAAENTITVSISTDNGGSWTVLGTRTPINTTLVAQTSFDLSSYNSTQVKVKFSVAGTNNSIGAGIDDISITGYLPSGPMITVNPISLTGMNYVFGNGPSAEQSFTVSGTNLTNNITLSSPSNYQISTTSGFGFTNSITLTQTAGTVSNTTIYVRLIAGLSVASYNGEIITASSTGATSQTVTCNGVVTIPADPSIPTSMFEIQNILVDACAGSVEGQNEMVIFQIGPADVNVNDLRVDGAGATGAITTGNWPNTTNNWLGISPPPSNPADVAYVNSTITSCGHLIEPIGGILPAGKKILMITSTAWDETAHSFVSLQDTLYIIFQNAGNTAGHFVNYGTVSERTFVLTHVPSGYADTVKYDRSLLETQAGVPGAEDGGAVAYTWSGIPDYYNNGCQAPYIPMDPSWNFSTSDICETDPAINLSSLVTGTPGGTWSGTGVSGTSFSPSGLNGSIDVTYTIGTAPCTATEMHSITVNTNTNPAFTTLGPYCVGDTPALLPTTSTNSITGTWSPATISTATAGTTVHTFTPTAGQCAVNTTMSVSVNATSILPSFTALGPYCVGDTPALLPTTSTNSITGTWSPATISTATAGTTVHTFTPTVGQCATTATMSVTINATSIIPTFTALGPYCVGATPAALSTTSTNGITGTWSPATISTAAAGTTVYTFTPTAGQCATTATMSVTVNSNTIPTFTALGPYCVGATPAALAGTSTNGITGTWSPATISTAASGTTVYTFTPTAGQCATTATMSVTVNSNTNPTFTALGPYCVGATPAALAGTSTNGVTGTWSPAAISTAAAGTTVYSFTPTAGQCATTATMSVTVNSNTNPSFTALGPYCGGATPAALAGTSTNGITGTWSPAAISTAAAGTTVYTFTPTAGQCATTVTMSVTVNSNTIPSYTALGPYCVGATPAALAGTSTNGVTGTWSPATISTAAAGTTVYTFTPTAGQCATTATMSVTVNSNTNPSFTALGPYCVGATPAALAGTSTNGVTGTWSPATISTAAAGTTVYTFTPTAGQCATTTTMSVTVNSNTNPTFTALGPYCVGATPAALAGTSTNGITGTWSPATISTAAAGTTVYTFTPTAGQCATTATMSVTVNSNTIPSFTAPGPYCVGAIPTALAGTSTNGVTGTWSPATISTAAAGTTVYTFTPTAGQCATTATMSVTVNSNTNPSFTALGPYCVGATPAALAGTSTNGITGTWSPAAISTAASGTTVYTFTPTAGQCATTATMSVIVDVSFTPTFTNTGPYCLGDTPTLLSTTSTNGITGSWSPVTISTSTSGTTNYTFTPDAGQCAVNISLPITVNSLPQLNLTGTDPLCFGDNNGYISASASGGAAGYSLTWAGGTYTMTGGNHSIAALGSGNYDFTVTDANNCTNTASQTLSDPAALGISVAYTPITIFGGTSTVTVSASGGTPGYTGTGTFNRIAGTYTYTVYDANGCSATQSITISQPAQLQISVTATPINCFGGTSTITVSASGGTAPYTGTGTFTEAAGTYSYTVSDASGASDSETITIVQPSELLISETIAEDTVCYGEFGNATIIVSGGVNPYFIQWQNGISSFTNSNITTNTNIGYTVTDNNGCTAQGSVFIYSSDELLISYTGSDETCFNSDDANITVTNLSGGTMPYFFAWSNGSTLPSLYGVNAGTYRVTLTDFYGCSATDEITVIQPAEIVLTLSSTDANCNGAGGSITSLVSGGTVPIDYNWSNLETTSSISDLDPGIYYVTISDASSCTLSDSVEIEITGNLNPLINITNPISCFGYNDGALSAVCNEAVAPISYTWSNGSISQQNTILPSGNYLVSLTDSRGCEGSASTMLNQPTQINISENLHNPHCHNTADGSISINITGGTAPYSGIWSNSQTGLNIAELSGGAYAVTVTDSRNCAVNETYVLTQPEAIFMDYQKTDILCYGDANGSIILTASGGSGSFSFSLEHNEIVFGGSNHFNLNGGYYTALVNDNNGCSQSTEIIISEPGLLDISFTSGNPSCIGMNDGYILAEVTGGVAPYLYEFNGLFTDIALIGNLKDGEYDLVVLDANNCKSEAGIVYLHEMDIDCIRIPNAFTPNGDGINDTWIIENILYFPDSYIQVFNRWGQELYNAKAEAGDWDGTYNDKFVPAGTYMYVIKLHNGTEAYTGMVSVIY